MAILSMRLVVMAIATAVVPLAAALADSPAALPQPGTRLFQATVSRPTKGRPGVQTVQRTARLSNERVLFQLSHQTNEGPSLFRSEDEQAEVTVRPYAPYRAAPNVAEAGFSALGLNPGGSWDGQGFFNLYINGFGLNYAAPELTAKQTVTQSLARLLWRNSQATVVQTCVLRSGDDKLLMKLEVQPQPGVKLESIVLQLRNNWHRPNSVYGNPSPLQGALFTSSGTHRPPQLLPLALPSQNWVVYGNEAQPLGPGGLLFPPGMVERAQVLAAADHSITSLILKPGRNSITLALWDTPKQKVDALSAYLRANATALGAELNHLAATDWASPLPALGGEQPLHLTDATYVPTTAEQASGLVPFASHPMSYVDANTLPGNEKPNLQLAGAPGTSEQAAFAIYSLKNQGRLTVTPAELRWVAPAGPAGGAVAGGRPAGGPVIAAANVDVRVVKVWPQQLGLWGGPSGEFAMTPELLLRDDSQDLNRAWTGPGSYSGGATAQGGFVTGPTMTQLPRDTSRQFWIKVQIPPDALPGLYRGSVEVRGESATPNAPALTPVAGEPTSPQRPLPLLLTLPITLRVWPIDLAPVSDKYTLGIYYRGRPSVPAGIGAGTAGAPNRAQGSGPATSPQTEPQEDATAPNTAPEPALPPAGQGPVSSQQISAERYAAELKELAGYGFNSLLLMPTNLEQLQGAMLPVYRQNGFSGPAFLANWGFAYNSRFNAATEAAHRQRVAAYLETFAGGKAPVFYGVDEPQGEKIALNIKRAQITRNVKVANLQGQYSSAGTGAALLPQLGHLDFPVISSYFSSREEMKSLRDKFTAAGAHPLYYWQAWGEYPQGNRLNAGYFLYASGYDGYLPYAYRHFESDPYNEDMARPATGNSSLKSMMLSYPCDEGFIPTLQGEALRAGILDLRYLLTLDNTIEGARGGASAAQLQAARATRDQLLDKYGYTGSKNWGRMIYGALNWPEHLQAIPPDQFDRDRRTVAELILKLQSL